MKQEIYEENKKKKRHALRVITRKGRKKAASSIRVLYVWTLILQSLAGAATLTAVIFRLKFPYEAWRVLGFFGIAGLFPLAVSFLTRVMCQNACGGEFCLRKKETLEVVEDGLIYTFWNCHSGGKKEKFVCPIPYSELKGWLYDESTFRMTLKGNLLIHIYEGEEEIATEEYAELSILNIFSLDIKELLILNADVSKWRVSYKKEHHA